LEEAVYVIRHDERKAGTLQVRIHYPGLRLGKKYIFGMQDFCLFNMFETKFSRHSKISG